MLCIDWRRLRSPVKWEDLYQAGEDFPHVYGPIDLEAVVAVVDFPPRQDGTFAVPEEVRRIAGVPA